MKAFLLWVSAIVITLSAAIYQRHTGPTYPKEQDIIINNTSYELKLVRSLALDESPEVKLDINDKSVSAKLYYKRYQSNDEYQAAEFSFRSEEDNEGFFAIVPQQPPAGKIQYYFEITDSKGTQTFFKESPVVIRFKGGVPPIILIPHILAMFVAMLFSTLAGLMAAVKYPQYNRYAMWTLILFTIGGMILGPIVQHDAFGDYWTGVPFGWDLTDNKTLIALLFWILAVVMNRKQEKPMYVVLASVVLLLVYSIPHSLFGSQLDYETGTVNSGIYSHPFLKFILKFLNLGAAF